MKLLMTALFILTAYTNTPALSQQEAAAILLDSERAGFEELTGKVIKITDGDTVHVLLEDYTKEKIRLAGIDAPERKQAFGEKSKQHLAALVFGKTVTVEYSKRDRYGRIVGKIIYDDIDVCLEMIKAGMAWHYKKYQNEQYKSDQLVYSDAEIKARTNKVGLFSDSQLIPPWKWRKK